MKILFVSPHAFLPSTRKAGVHFISEALAARGHSVATISVGYSMLTRFKDPDLFRALASAQRNRFVEQYPGYRSACYLPLLHPFSSGNALIDSITSVFFRLYGRLLPRFMKDEVKAADIVLLESGTSLCFFDAIHRANKRACVVYFRRDRLDTIGASRYLTSLDQRLAGAFDWVFANSPRMTEHLPPEVKVKYIPQGIRKTSFDKCETSPYAAGTKNAVAVGNMLFDDAAVSAMARHNPSVMFHLFGRGIAGDFPSNVKVYGERSFEEIVPYIKFADFGLAPYRLTEKEIYLVESSLKMLQYSYCLLPILAPDLLAGARDNIIPYRQTGEDDWAGIVQRALAAGKDPKWRDGILSWDEVGAEIEAFDLFKPHSPGRETGASRTRSRPMGTAVTVSQ